MTFSAPSPISLEAACWDPWLLKDGDLYRMFYLSGQPDQVPWWKSSWICGAVSTDLRHWQHLGRILEPLPNAGWESGRLFAGSCYREDAQYYLFYSGASAQNVDQEAIGLAMSGDGMTWQRLAEPLLALPTTASPYGRCNRTAHLHWRDPAIHKDDASQTYYLYFCASLAVPGPYQGGLGLAVADQLAGPYQLLSPPIGPEISGSEDWPFYHLERPQILYRAGQYHLFFSCFKEFVNPRWLAQLGPVSITDSTLYWYVADRITGPFEPVATVPVVPGSDRTGLYGTQFFPLSELGESASMMVFGWYAQTYKLAVSQEFSGVYQAQGFTNTLRIVANL